MKKVVVLFLSLMLLLCACTSQTDNNSQAQSSESSEESVNQISIPDVSDANMSDISSTMPEDGTSNEDNTSNTMSEDDTSGEDSRITFSDGDLLSQKDLADSDKQIIMRILGNDEGWISDIPDCDWICWFSGVSVSVGYCDCGTISDFANNRSRKLTAEEKESVESLISRYGENSQNNNQTNGNETPNNSIFLYIPQYDGNNEYYEASGFVSSALHGVNVDVETVVYNHLVNQTKSHGFI